MKKKFIRSLYKTACVFNKYHRALIALCMNFILERLQGEKNHVGSHPASTAPRPLTVVPLPERSQGFDNLLDVFIILSLQVGCQVLIIHHHTDRIHTLYCSCRWWSHSARCSSHCSWYIFTMGLSIKAISKEQSHDDLKV